MALHGGQGAASRHRFQKLTRHERTQMRTFLETLGAPGADGGPAGVRTVETEAPAAQPPLPPRPAGRPRTEFAPDGNRSGPREAGADWGRPNWIHEQPRLSAGTLNGVESRMFMFLRRMRRVAIAGVGAVMAAFGAGVLCLRPREPSKQSVAPRRRDDPVQATKPPAGRSSALCAKPTAGRSSGRSSSPGTPSESPITESGRRGRMALRADSRRSIGSPRVCRGLQGRIRSGERLAVRGPQRSRRDRAPAPPAGTVRGRSQGRRGQAGSRGDRTSGTRLTTAGSETSTPSSR